MRLSSVSLTPLKLQSMYSLFVYFANPAFPLLMYVLIVIKRLFYNCFRFKITTNLPNYFRENSMKSPNFFRRNGMESPNVGVFEAFFGQ